MNGKQNTPSLSNSPGTQPRSRTFSGNGSAVRQGRPTLPFRSGKPLMEFTPEEYHEFIRAKHQLPVSKSGAPALPLSFRRNDKGTPIITVRGRKPKWATRDEVRALAQASENISEQELFVLAGQKKIKLVATQAEGEQYAKDHNSTT